MYFNQPCAKLSAYVLNAHAHHDGSTSIKLTTQKAESEKICDEEEEQKRKTEGKKNGNRKNALKHTYRDESDATGATHNETIPNDRQMRNCSTIFIMHFENSIFHDDILLPVSFSSKMERKKNIPETQYAHNQWKRN